MNNHHATPSPGPDCPRFADILPVLADRDDALAVEARLHLAGCAYCQAQQRAYVRLESALRHTFGSAATPHIRTEDIMASLPNDNENATPVAPRSIPPQRTPRRILSSISAVAAVIVVVVLAVAIFANHPHITTVGGHTTPTPPSSFAHPGFQDTLASISMVSPTEGWAVGQSVDVRTAKSNSSVPYLLHDHAGIWQKVSVDLHMTADCHAYLNGVAMVNASDGWAVGGIFCPYGDSLVLHYDGQAWTRVAVPYHDNLGGVTMLSADDGWAYNSPMSSTPPTLLHYTQGQWSSIHLPVIGSNTYGAFVGLAVVNNHDIWAAEQLFGNGATMTTSVDTTSAFLHYLNGTWNVAQIFPYTNLNGLAMAAANDGWAIGYHQKANDGRAINTNTSFHYAHGVWTETPAAIGQPTEVGAAIVFDRPTDGWVIIGGSYLPSVANLYHFTGSAWASVQVPLPVQDSTQSYSFAALPDGEVWEVGGAVSAHLTSTGQSFEPLILHYSNGQWSVIVD